jgi:hypothetical protein
MFLIKILTGRLFYKTSVKKKQKLCYPYSHSLINWIHLQTLVHILA